MKPVLSGGEGGKGEREMVGDEPYQGTLQAYTEMSK
jgi:hypothetical protein